MPKYDFLIFDMDGTFIDSAPFHITAYHRFFDKYKIDVSLGDTVLGLGFTIEDMFRNIGVPEEGIDEVYEKLAAFYSEEIDDLVRSIPLIDGTREVFRTLADRGYPMSVVTNSLQPAADKILDLHELDHYFKVVAGASQQESDKEKRCMDVCKAHCQEGRVLLIGDAGRDMEIANDAGWDCCLAATNISWAQDPKAVIEKFSPTYVVNGFPELLELLD